MNKIQPKESLVGLTVEQIGERLQPLGEPPYRAVQVYKWVHHHAVGSIAEMTNISKSLRTTLADNFILSTLELARRQDSIDGTRKYLWKLPDGHHIESVFIPETKRITLCISSQVGCALGCHFCATAKMGFLRNLTPGEIVDQVLRIQQDTAEKTTNVVFMGMGEPFLNYSRVIQASRILNDPAGAAISAKKITISTVGVVPKILQFADEQQPFSLAISLHSPSQDLRREFMPIADKFDLDDLMKSAWHYTRVTGKRITFEYVLLEGVNDNPAEAKALRKLLDPLKCKLNLIPYNNTGLNFSLPTQKRQTEFLSWFETAPFTVTLRKNRGNDIAAACGQLMVASENTDKSRSLLRNG